MCMGKRIKERRKELGYTQEELAQKLGLQKSAVAKYENGRVVNIKRSVLVNMARILDCSPSYLMGLTQNLDSETNILFEVTARSLTHSPGVYESLLNYVKEVFPKTPLEYNHKTYDGFYSFLCSPDVSFEEKANFLRQTTEYIILDSSAQILNIVFSIAPKEETVLANKIQFNTSKLNLEGLKKLADYSSDLTSIDQYLKEDDDSESSK